MEPATIALAVGCTVMFFGFSAYRHNIPLFSLRKNFRKHTHMQDELVATDRTEPRVAFSTEAELRELGIATTQGETFVRLHNIRTNTWTPTDDDFALAIHGDSIAMVYVQPEEPWKITFSFRIPSSQRPNEECRVIRYAMDRKEAREFFLTQQQSPPIRSAVTSFPLVRHYDDSTSVIIFAVNARLEELMSIHVTTLDVARVIREWDERVPFSPSESIDEALHKILG